MVWRNGSFLLIIAALCTTVFLPVRSIAGETGTPIIIDLAHNGYNLTSPAIGVRFDIDGNGFQERISWTATGSDDGFLALDRNLNGTIDDGRELFGDVTPQAPGPFGANGWNALMLYDGNGDNVINASDSIFTDLRVWIDLNHNGFSEGSELRTLSSLNILSISLAYSYEVWTDQWGNEFRWKSHMGTRVAYDVYLKRYLGGG
jgi:hypothetical protein